jgi:tetratricopeptide (TPR) repeat protein
MALSENDIELIEKYLDQVLTDEEKILFDNLMISSKEFVSQLELAKSTVSALREKHNTKIKDDLKTIYQATKSEKPHKTDKKFYWMAAAILILTLSPALYWYFVPNTSNQELYMAHYEVYPASPNVRGEGSTTTLASAMEYYRNADYKRALDLFMEYHEANTQFDQILLYIGNCYLNLDETNKAIVYFKKGQKSDDAIIKKTSSWYLALCYLNTEQLDKCQDLLNMIIYENELYAKEAKVLINEIH